MRIVLALSLFLFACGGGSKAAPEEPADESLNQVEGGPDDPELCCCEYVEETGEGDEMSEEMVTSMMPPEECAGSSGQCLETADACTVE